MMCGCVSVAIPLGSHDDPVAIVVNAGVNVDVLWAEDAHVPPKGRKFVTVLLGTHSASSLVTAQYQTFMRPCPADIRYTEWYVPPTFDRYE